MIRYGIFFTILFSIGISCSCASKSAKSKQKEISISDNYQKTKDGEIIVDDRDFDRNQPQIAMTKESTQEKPQTGSDGSEIQAMTDGFGNRIETRVFQAHPLLQRIVLRTFADGRKKVFVYGQNGEVNNLPEEMSDKSMAAPADELAQSAGIYTGRDENNVPYFLRQLQQKQQETLVPTYEFPIQTSAPEQIPGEVQTAQTPPFAEPVIEQKTAIQAPKSTPEKNYQAELNKILLQSNKRRTAKTEGTLTQKANSESIEKSNK